MTAKTGQLEQLKLILARGTSYAEAARQTGMSERTVRRYIAKPEFNLDVHQRRQEILEGLVGTLVNACEDSIKILHELAKSATNEVVRANAARFVVEFTLKFQHESDHARRLKAIEAHLAELDAAQPRRLP